MPSGARLEITIHTCIRKTIIRIRIQGKNFENFYIVDGACSFYLCLVLRRSVLMISDSF